MNQLILYACIAAAAFASGAWVNGSVWESKYTALKLEQSQQQVKAKDANMVEVLESINSWQSANQRNEQAYAELNKTVTGMRSAIGGLRLDTERFTAAATQAQLRAYSEACTAVFHTMAAEIGSLGEAGAAIARQADRHYADTELIRQKP